MKILPIKFADEYSRRAGSRAALGQYKDAAEDLTKVIELTDRKVAHYFAERAQAFDRLGEKAAAEADRKAAEALGFKLEKGEQGALVGTWTGTYTTKGVKVTEVITLRADGTLNLALNQAGRLGSEKMTDTGTWSATKTTLIFTTKQHGKFVHPIEVSGDELRVEMEELGLTITFTRNK